MITIFPHPNVTLHGDVKLVINHRKNSYCVLWSLAILLPYLSGLSSSQGPTAPTSTDWLKKPSFCSYMNWRYDEYQIWCYTSSVFQEPLLKNSMYLKGVEFWAVRLCEGCQESRERRSWCYLNNITQTITAVLQCGRVFGLPLSLVHLKSISVTFEEHFQKIANPCSKRCEYCLWHGPLPAVPVVPQTQCATKALRLAEHSKSASECVGSNAPLFLSWPSLEKEGRKKWQKC